LVRALKKAAGGLLEALFFRCALKTGAPMRSALSGLRRSCSFLRAAPLRPWPRAERDLTHHNSGTAHVAAYV